MKKASLSRKRIFLAILALLALLLWDLRRFSNEIWDLPEVDAKSLPRVDLIAVLTGGQGRLREALLLFRDGKGQKLLISGVAEGSTLGDILRANDLESFPAELLMKISLDTESRSTHDNVRAIKNLIQKSEGPASVLVVTSTYHMRRTLRLLAAELHQDVGLQVQFYPFPVDSKNFPKERWWKDPTGWEVFLSEYTKSLSYRWHLI